MTMRIPTILALGVATSVLVAYVLSRTWPSHADVSAVPADQNDLSIPVAAPPTTVLKPPGATQSDPLMLIGTLAAADPKAGTAMLGTSREVAAVFAADAEVLPGVQLLEIYADHVIIDRNGARETIFLAQRDSRSSITGVGATPSADTLVQNAGIRHNPGATIVSGEETYDAPAPGIRVFAGRDRAGFARLGLRPGDVLTAVNGSAVGSDTSEVSRQLADLGEATLTVYRRGQLQQITVHAP